MDAAWKRTIKRLFPKAKAGDEVALNDLLCHVRPWCFSIAYRILRDGHDAEHAVQDALIEMAKHIAQCHTTFDGWAFRVVSRQALKILREPRLPSASDPDLIGSVGQSSQDRVVERERAQVIAEAILRLEQNQRNVVILYYFVGLPEKEIAGVLGMPVNTVKSHLRRAREKLREDRDVQAQGSPSA